jgi:hypothetical protein
MVDILPHDREPSPLGVLTQLPELGLGILAAVDRRYASSANPINGAKAAVAAGEADWSGRIPPRGQNVVRVQHLLQPLQEVARVVKRLRH